MLQGEHSEILSTFIKLPFVIKIVLSIFEWPFKTGLLYIILIQVSVFVKRQQPAKKMSTLTVWSISYACTTKQ